MNWVSSLLAASVSFILCVKAFARGYYAIAVAYGVLGGVCAGAMMVLM